jgi:membrane protease YdiL (CAAX protease family)
MRTTGSDRVRQAILAGLSPVVVYVGVAAMVSLSLLTRSLGLRPMLVASEVGLVLPGLLLVGLVAAAPAASLGLRRIDRRTALLSLAAGATLWGTSLGLFEVQYVFWSPPAGYLEAFRALHDALRPSGPLDALISVLAIAIAPAICEEALFRGVVLPPLAQFLGGLAAALISAALFGAIHVDFATGVSYYRVPFAFAIGLGLAALRLRTGSLFPSTLAHATLNTITFLAAPLTDDPAGGLPDPRPLLGISMLLVGAAASLFVIRAIRPLTRGGSAA